MSKEPKKNVKVEVQDLRTGDITKPQVFKAPEPGTVTIWDIRTGFELHDLISIRIDWPANKKKKKHNFDAKQWSADDEECLKNLYKELSDYQLGKRLNRTAYAITKKRHKLGLTR